MKEVGRNDPCPCGSGKKFKKCCAQKSSMERHTFSAIDTSSSASSMSQITGMISKTLRKNAPEETEGLKDKINKKPPTPNSDKET